MEQKKLVHSTDTEEIMRKLGERIKRARLRRNIRVESLAKQAGISRGTLSSIEKGALSVSVGAWVAVLSVFGMEKDLENIAVDTEGKKQFWEQNLCRRERASRRQEIK
jgi:transcriptional regulator with XRE-family HTH domain